MNKIKNRREREVWTACDELWNSLADENKSLQTLTGERIRNKLEEMGYKKGNRNQIFQYRKTWKQAKGLIEEDNELAVKKNIITDKIQQLISILIDEIYQDSNKNIEETKSQAQQLIMSLQRERDQLQDNYNHLSRTYQVCLNNLTQSKENLNKVSQSITSNETKIEQIEKRYEALQAEVEEFIVNFKSLQETNFSQIAQIKEQLTLLQENHEILVEMKQKLSNKE